MAPPQPPPPLTIRRATRADAAAIAHVHKTSWDKAYPSLVPSSILDTRSVAAVQARWEATLDTPGVDVYVAELEGREPRVVGFAAAGPPKDADMRASGRAKIELYALHVLPDLYGLGAAKRLIDEALGDQDACLYFIDGNARAEAFYAKNGFQRDGKSKSDKEFWGGNDVPEVRVVRVRKG